MARRGSYIAKNVVLMPSYTNVGAYVDEGTMVDTWATVGSCAQIGKKRPPVRRRRHRRRARAAAGQPDDHRGQLLHRRALRGRRRRRRRGEQRALDGRVHRPEHQIFNRETGEVLYGRVPSGSVVVAGTMPSGDRSCALYCAVIVKRVDAKTRAKTSPERTPARGLAVKLRLN
jgi:2,3,4,5-tetrahydropyridine-2-carboxylate N-succinyltransferase